MVRSPAFGEVIGVFRPHQIGGNNYSHPASIECAHSQHAHARTCSGRFFGLQCCAWPEGVDVMVVKGAACQVEGRGGMISAAPDRIQVALFSVAKLVPHYLQVGFTQECGGCSSEGFYVWRGVAFRVLDTCSGCYACSVVLHL